jgi:hypothetical protein
VGGEVILNVCLAGGNYGGVLRPEGGERQGETGEQQEGGARGEETGFTGGDSTIERLGSHIGLW